MTHYLFFGSPRRAYALLVMTVLGFLQLFNAGQILNISEEMGLASSNASGKQKREEKG